MAETLIYLPTVRIVELTVIATPSPIAPAGTLVNGDTVE